MTKQEILDQTIQMLADYAVSIATEELIGYENEHPNTFIKAEVCDLIKQRTSSEAFFRACKFVCPSQDVDRDQLTQIVEDWFKREEEERLRQMCQVAIKEEVKKHEAPGEENLSFSERFKREVQKRTNTIDLLKGLQQ